MTAGWLSELAAVVHSDAYTACASPLSNNATFYSGARVRGGNSRRSGRLPSVCAAACAGLPRWTEMPTAHGFCVYMSGQGLDLIGHLDPIFSPG